jgi:AcrR family transcriptional regulator
MTLRSETDIQPVLRAALALVETGGLRGLSLRPLAERMGTTVSALSHRFGLKDELLAAVIDAARETDGALLDGWLKRIEALAPLDGALLADLVDLLLDEMAGPYAALNRFYCELMQAAPTRPEVAAAFAAWRARRLAFWRAAAGARQHTELGAELGDVLHAFSADEVAHGLAIGDLSAYRWLRRLGLRRLCGAVVAAPGVNDLAQFAVCHAALGALMDGPDGYQPAPLTDWQAKVAGHISSLIITEGADAVTHRAIAARAGVASSTLAYHFPRQEDLLQAGLEAIIARLHGRVYRPHGVDLDAEDLSSVEIARATFAVALAVGRAPGLKACAADMRRRRGENYMIILNRQTAGEPVFDLLSGQALSITGIGQIMLDGLLDGASGAIDRTLIDKLQAVALAAR